MCDQPPSDPAHHRPTRLNRVVSTSDASIRKPMPSTSPNERIRVRIMAITHSSVIAMIRTRMRSFGLVLGIGFLMLASLVLTTLFSLVGRWWAGSLGGWSHIVPLVDLVATLVLSWGLFALVYKLLPSCKVTWMDVWIGAFATSLLFTLGKVAIGIYLARSNVTAMFGAAGSIALVLLWLYYAAQVFLLGAEFTHVYAMSHGSMARDATEDAPQQPHRAAVLVPGLTE